MDSGSDISLISYRMYRNLPDKPNKDPSQFTGYQPPEAIGQINLSFTMNGLPFTQNVLVTRG